MGQIIIQEETTKNPITLIGKQAGVCWGGDVSDNEKNFKRGIDCLNSGHGRTFEFPDVYLILDGYSARVMREWYTHIGGTPTRLQASTRYVNYEKGFDYVTPHTIEKNPMAQNIYDNVMNEISIAMLTLMDDFGIPREDAAMLLPLGMSTKVVGKYNARTLIDMSHQRKCRRAYWEYRELFEDLEKSLSNYSEEWKLLVDNYFKPKCQVYGKCVEKNSCMAKS